MASIMHSTPFAGAVLKKCSDHLHNPVNYSTLPAVSNFF
jgi:hypothetical protein